MDDTIIGLVRIDLTVLINRQFNICGWFDVLNSSEQLNGQIKVSILPKFVLPLIRRWIERPVIIICQINIEPKDDLQVYRDKQQSNIADHDLDTPDEGTTPESDVSFHSDMSDDYEDIQPPFSLNRVLKRKFTELEEITERLRARLLHVTEETKEADKAATDDDEFESDLNTQPEEESGEWSFFDANAENTFNGTANAMAGASSYQPPPPLPPPNHIQLNAGALGNSELTETTNDGSIAMAQSHDTAP